MSSAETRAGATQQMGRFFAAAGGRVVCELAFMRKSNNKPCARLRLRGRHGQRACVRACASAAAPSLPSLRQVLEQPAPGHVVARC